MTARWWHSADKGYSFIELIVATGIMMVLASAALPIVRVSVRRQKEAELRYNLRQIRTAIDQFKDLADVQRIAQSETDMGSENYPRSLEQLVDGVTYANDVSGRKKKFLRRIPPDPITGRADWGLRSYTDLPDARAWGGGSVFDVYSKAEGKALDGTKYRDW